MAHGGMRADLSMDMMGASGKGPVPKPLQISDFASADTLYMVKLEALNGSGVQGAAFFAIDGDQLTVAVYADGVDPGFLHMQHIHGLPGTTNATVPPPEAAGADGVLSVGEGVPFYGPVLLPLLPYPVPDDDTIFFTQTFTLTSEDLMALEDEVYVLHGGFVDGVYVPSLPIAAGEIMKVGPGEEVSKGEAISTLAQIRNMADDHHQGHHAGHHHDHDWFLF